MDLYDAFLSIENKGDIEKLFDELFTPSEKKRLLLRWRLLGMLRRRTPQRKIASELGISLCKITRGAGILRKKDSLLYRILSEGDKDGNSED
ncbi:MAG: hypothetical protein A2Y33_09435 [Spirochaetes bacterium GWF1_51_8]|nr:MAG: hypothetical protein A2Y33_09435 [Spirochaetes bacterium GWF1_51_8]